MNNVINDLESRNKLLKHAILCPRTPTLLQQYIALHYYKQQYLERDYKNDLDSQIMQFLVDIKRVYPGVVDGVKQSGLELQEIDEFEESFTGETSDEELLSEWDQFD